MKTFREKVSFILTALAYLLFHLGKSPDTGSILIGTTMALMNTLPYEIGLTYLILVFIRRLTKGEWPPWDRILRIFFTIGILFGLIYNLYVKGALEEQRLEQEKVNVSRCWEGGNRMGPSYWA
jgi:hypothetical protein